MSRTSYTEQKSTDLEGASTEQNLWAIVIIWLSDAGDLLAVSRRISTPTARNAPTAIEKGSPKGRQRYARELVAVRSAGEQRQLTFH
jgi:hypothetical protein